MARLAGRRFDEALAYVAQRAQNFWLDRDVTRRALWEACGLMAELGKAAADVSAEVKGVGGGPADWVAHEAFDQHIQVGRGPDRSAGSEERVVMPQRCMDEPLGRCVSARKSLVRKSCHGPSLPPAPDAVAYLLEEIRLLPERAG